LNLACEGSLVGSCTEEEARMSRSAGDDAGALNALRDEEQRLRLVLEEVSAALRRGDMELDVDGDLYRMLWRQCAEKFRSAVSVAAKQYGARKVTKVLTILRFPFGVSCIPK